MSNKEKLDLEREDVKKLITILATNSYGTATFTIDETLNPATIILDGAVYDVHNEDHIKQLVEHFGKIKSAVKKVEKKYRTSKDLPQHIDSFIYNYHPRWISARKQYNMIPQVKDEIECPFSMANIEKPYHKWNQCFWVSTGSLEPECNIPYDQKMSAKEYEDRLDEITFNSNHNYFQKYTNEFFRLYKGNANLETLKQQITKLLSYQEYNAEIDDLSDSIRQQMRLLDYNSERKANQNINKEFYHSDLNAFIDTYYYCTLYQNQGVTMKFSVQDNFPIIAIKNKTFDLRTPNALALFMNNMAKISKNNSQSKRNLKNKRKKH